MYNLVTYFKQHEKLKIFDEKLTREKDEEDDLIIRFSTSTLHTLNLEMLFFPEI